MTVAYNDKGEAIRDLQRRLMDRGYVLPQFGADGHLGEETWEALERFARDHDLRWRPTVPPHVVAQLLVRPPPTASPPPLVLPRDAPAIEVGVFDLRPFQSVPAPKSRVLGGRTVLRAPSAVTHVMVHQMAINFGVAPYQVLAAGGDEDLAQRHRALNVAAHVTTFREGWVCKVNDVLAYIHHGNTTNRFSNGLEIEGIYPGLVDRPHETTWGDQQPQTLDDVALEAARAGLRVLVEDSRAAHQPVPYVIAHRQANATRRADPGEEIWRKVVLEYGVPKLGLETQPHRTWGSGKPIPKEWDPDGVGRY